MKSSYTVKAAVTEEVVMAEVLEVGVTVEDSVEDLVEGSVEVAAKGEGWAVEGWAVVKGWVVAGSKPHPVPTHPGRKNC